MRFARDFKLAVELDFCEILNGTNHLAGVAVLIVIPGNNLYLIGIVVDLGNHCLGSVKQRTVGDADNIDRFDAFRIYDKLTWVDYKNLSLEKQKEHVDTVLSSLNKYLDYECATRTATFMWKEKISFQLEFYNRLKKQIENSTVKN